jgi:hypothetical protein
MPRVAQPVDPGRADRIRQALRMAGVGVGEAAARIGCHPVYLSRVIAGERQGGSYMPKLAVALRVPLPWLETGRGEAPAWASPGAGAAASAYAEGVAFLAAAERSIAATAKARGDDVAPVLDALAKVRRKVERL